MLVLGDGSTALGVTLVLGSPQSSQVLSWAISRTDKEDAER